jgi:hypothetical protein
MIDYENEKNNESKFYFRRLLAITVVFVSGDTLEEQPEGNVLNIRQSEV